MQGTECGMMTPEVMAAIAPKLTESVVRALLELRLKEIVRQTAEEYGVPLERLLSRKRDQHTANCRQVAMYWCRKLTVASFPLIAQVLGRDHSSIVHGVQLVERRWGERALLVKMGMAN